MDQIPQWATQALGAVYDPCCQEKGISVVDTGLPRSVTLTEGRAKVELLLTTGWCPFAARVLTDVQKAVEAVPGVDEAEVDVVWDEAWTTDRLSESATRKLRFLPPPVAVSDRDAYLAAHAPAEEAPGPSSSTTSATTTGRPTRGAWTTPGWPSRSSRRRRNWVST